MFTETGDCGSLYYGSRTLRDPNSSSHSRNKLDRPSGVPDGSETPQCPSWKKSCNTPSISTLCQSSSTDTLERLGRKCQLRDMAWDQRSLSSTIGSVELPEGPAMVSEGPEGRGTSWDVTSSSFGATDIVALGAQQILFGACSKGIGAHHPSMLGEGLWKKEGLTCQLCGCWQPCSPLAASQGYLPMPT